MKQPVEPSRIKVALSSTGSPQHGMALLVRTRVEACDRAAVQRPAQGLHQSLWSFDLLIKGTSPSLLSHNEGQLQFQSKAVEIERFC